MLSELIKFQEPMVTLGGRKPGKGPGTKLLATDVTSLKTNLSPLTINGLLTDVTTPVITDWRVRDWNQDVLERVGP